MCSSPIAGKENGKKQTDGDQSSSLEILIPLFLGTMRKMLTDVSLQLRRVLPQQSQMEAPQQGLVPAFLDLIKLVMVVRDEEADMIQGFA